MDLEEGVGESSSPPGSFGDRNDVFNRLVETGNQEAIINPELKNLLNSHFNRFPASYGLLVNMEKLEVVLLHQKLLALAKDPQNRPVYHVRFLENLHSKREANDDQRLINSYSIQRPLDDGDGGEFLPFHEWQALVQIPTHEVIFSTTDRPKLLSQLSALLSDIKLNICEAYVFSTTDGYLFGLFVVDGWPVEDTDGLYKAIGEAVARCKGSLSGDWEIDRRLLKIGEGIASGSGGDLYNGTYLGQDVAVKILRSEQLNDALEAEVAQEVAILQEVKHDNIVRFIGACTKSPPLCIVTEFMPRGSLYDYLHKNHNVLKRSQLLKFAIDICKGMEYLHQSHIIHRDLKTANLLIDTDNVVKVADFGVARFQNQGGVMTAETGTYGWMAPEVMNHLLYDHKDDVFSFAIVLWELVTAKVPYDTMTPLQAALGVKQGRRPNLPENAHPKLVELMQRCWETAPEKRPSFSEITVELETLFEEVKVEFSR